MIVISNLQAILAIIRHQVMWPWPHQDEPRVAGSHPWLDLYRWMRGDRRWWALLIFWAGLVGVSGGLLMYVPILRDRPGNATGYGSPVTIR